jgi:hypothetical protein
MALRRALGGGGSRGWAYTAVGLVGLRVVRAAVRKRPQTVYRAKVRPGETIQVRAFERR